MRPSLVLYAALFLLCSPALAQGPPPQGAPAAQSRAGISFDGLKGLAGEWTGTVRTTPTNPDLDGPIQVTMRVASHGSALVHEIAPGGVPEPTLIFVEGEHLTMIHYCDAGNRPRLIARDDTNLHTVDFVFDDISGSKSPLYLRRFVFRIADGDHHTEDWTFALADGKALLAHFDLKRTKGGAPQPSGN